MKPQVIGSRTIIIAESNSTAQHYNSKHDWEKKLVIITTVQIKLVYTNISVLVPDLLLQTEIETIIFDCEFDVQQSRQFIWFHAAAEFRQYDPCASV